MPDACGCNRYFAHGRLIVVRCDVHQEEYRQRVREARWVGCGRCGGTGGIPAGPFGGGRDRCPNCRGGGSVPA